MLRQMTAQRQSEHQFFQSAREFGIYGGTFNQAGSISTIVNTGGHNLKGLGILLQNIASGAFHNSKDRFDPPKCHPNTRVAVLKTIANWVNDPSSSSIMWIYGAAGAGKSAIIQSIAEYLYSEKKLAASFFFSRTASAERGSAERLIATIAYQIALSLPEARKYIIQATENDPTVFSRSLETQVKYLLVDPLASAGITGETEKKVVAIDGLDECQDEKVQCSILRAISGALKHLPLCFLIASRPEPNILRTFNESEIDGMTVHLVLDDSFHPDEDIKTYLGSKFDELKRNHILGSSLAKAWPSRENINTLVERSSGQFIYASTAVNYIHNPDQHPDNQLQIILGLSPSHHGSAPFAQLDVLYKHILSRVSNSILTLRVLGCLLLNHPAYRPLDLPQMMVPEFVDAFLCLRSGDTRLALSRLHSVLYIPQSEDDTKRNIHFFHKSFRDFILDRFRSEEYFIDIQRVHGEAARLSLRHQNSASKCSSLFRYSSKYFVFHLLNSDAISARDLMANFDPLEYIQFLSQNFVAGYTLTYSLPVEEIIALTMETSPGTRGELQDILREFQAAFDKYHHIILENYPQDQDIPSFVFLAVHHLLHSTSILYGILDMDDSMKSVIKQADSEGLRLQDFDSLRWPSYRRWLTKFLEDPLRAGKYYLDGSAYAELALSILRYIFNIPNVDLIDSEISEIHCQGLGAAFYLISKASLLEDLAICLREINFRASRFQMLQDGTFDTVTTFSQAKQITAAYLKKYDNYFRLKSTTLVPEIAVPIYMGRPQQQDGGQEETAAERLGKALRAQENAMQSKNTSLGSTTSSISQPIYVRAYNYFNRYLNTTL